MSQLPQPTQQPLDVDEEWYAVDVETRLNKKMDLLQELVYQQSQLIQQLSTEIVHLKTELSHSKTTTHTQNDRTHQLLEELKVLKQRELNLALRSHLPVPFFTTVSATGAVRSPILSFSKAGPSPQTPKGGSFALSPKGGSFAL